MAVITISIVAYNQRGDLERLLPGLMSAAQRVQADVCLVVYRSDDGSREFVCREFPAVSLIENRDSAGYGRNHNLNLQRSAGKYFVVMNSDMAVGPDTFAELERYMDEHPDVVMVAPRILNSDGSVQELNKRDPTVLDVLQRLPLPPIVSKWAKARIDYYEMRDMGYEMEIEAPCLSGCFLFCRREPLERLGGFDENFFLYFEDNDLCRRMRQIGRIVYNPSVSVTHFWARRSRKSLRYTWYFAVSAWRYFNKWGWSLS